MNWCETCSETLYSIGVHCRNALYSKEIIRSKRINVPVISVGALSVGGAGKTPFVQALVGFLNEEFHDVCPAVVLRGYGRSTRGGMIVADKERVYVSDARRAGDEAVLHAEKLRSSPVVVHARRFKGAIMAVRDCRANCVILDDGFQHLSLHRDCDIVLLDSFTLENIRLLPAGRLREGFAALSRADIICRVRHDAEIEHHQTQQRFQEALAEANNAFVMEISMILGVPYSATAPMNKDVAMPSYRHIPTDPAFALAGIAFPERFFSALRHHSWNIVSVFAFPDHHPYSRDDVKHILRAMQLTQTQILVITEKDYVKLRIFCDIFVHSSIHLVVVPVQCRIDSGRSQCKKYFQQKFESLLLKPTSNKK